MDRAPSSIVDERSMASMNRIVFPSRNGGASSHFVCPVIIRAMLFVVYTILWLQPAAAFAYLRLILIFSGKESYIGHDLPLCRLVPKNVTTIHAIYQYCIS